MYGGVTGNAGDRLPMSLAQELTHGTKLGPYEILSSFGAGGMGEVYRARDTRLDRPSKCCPCISPTGLSCATIRARGTDCGHPYAHAELCVPAELHELLNRDQSIQLGKTFPPCRVQKVADKRLPRHFPGRYAVEIAP